MSLLPLVERYLRDRDAWRELFGEGFEPGAVRVVAETEERIVVEYRLVDSALTVCEIYDVRDGAIVDVRSFSGAEGLAELTRSRARVVAAADETRRRIQRDLHDGAQQRLVQSIITLKLAKADPSPELIEEALGQAERAMSDLRELVHGIMPAALTRGGLRSGIESLADRVALPVDVDVEPGRTPPQVETTAYFVIAEALTNAAKHAGATGASVRAATRDRELVVEVRDNGVGGADPARGSGLLGLADRVAACGGSLALDSPPGGGTTLTVALPL
jgi:signal transduction histidine kinase